MAQYEKISIELRGDKNSGRIAYWIKLVDQYDTKVEAFKALLDRDMEKPDN